MCDRGKKKPNKITQAESKDQHFYSSYWKIQTNKQMCRVLHALGCWRGHMPSSASGAMPAPLSSRTSQCPLPGPGRQMPWPAAVMGLRFWWWSQHMRCSLLFSSFQFVWMLALKKQTWAMFTAPKSLQRFFIWRGCGVVDGRGQGERGREKEIWVDLFRPFISWGFKVLCFDSLPFPDLFTWGPWAQRSFVGSILDSGPINREATTGTRSA